MDVKAGTRLFSSRVIEKTLDQPGLNLILKLMNGFFAAFEEAKLAVSERLEKVKYSYI